MKYETIGRDCETLRALLNFCRLHRTVYLYGAGHYGDLYKIILEGNGIPIAGFIVTKKAMELYRGLPVYAAEDIVFRLDDGDGIILAMSDKNRLAVMQEISFPCDVYAGSNDQIVDIAYGTIFHYLDSIEYDSPLPAREQNFHLDKILVVELERTFGDMVWSSAFMRELRRNHPAARIDLVIAERMAELYKHCPYIDELIPYDLQLPYEDFFLSAAKVEDLCNIYSLEYDAVFLPRPLPVAHCDVWSNVLLALHSKAKLRVAQADYFTEQEKTMADALGKYFSTVVKHIKGEHKIFQNLDMLQACGDTIQNDKTEMWLGEAERRFADEFFRNNRIAKGMFVIAVGITGGVPMRSWAPEKYREFFHAAMLTYGNLVKFIICGGNEAKAAADIAIEGLGSGCVNACGETSLLEVAAIMERCNMYVGSDTGLMHLAAATGIPVVELSPTMPEIRDTHVNSPVRSGPWGVDSILLRPRHGVDGCSEVCEKDYAHCINEISATDVEAAVCEMMKRLGR